MKTKLRGTVRGKTIDLQGEPGLPDGQEVSVTLEPVEKPHTPGDGIRESAGGWAEDAAELEEYLDWNRKQRKIGRLSLDS